MSGCKSTVYNSKKDIPAPIISDGTVEIISMIYALFFEQNKFIVIEEPRGNRLSCRLFSRRT